jgi:hypothetical protein
MHIQSPNPASLSSANGSARRGQQIHTLKPPPPPHLRACELSPMVAWAAPPPRAPSPPPAPRPAPAATAPGTDAPAVIGGPGDKATGGVQGQEAVMQGTSRTVRGSRGIHAELMEGGRHA